MSGTPNGTTTDYDVVIAGAGIGGCVAATLYGRQGLRVALLEAHTDPRTFKRACTHFIQPSAFPTLRRLGLDGPIQEAGGVPNDIDVWTRYGRVPALRLGRDLDGPGYNLRRSVLDPMLREMAASAPGVDLLLGHKVQHLLRDGSRVVGVVARGPDATPHAFRAPLTVGADGRHSTVAAQSGLPMKTSKNERFGYFAHYTGLQMQTTASSQLWLDGQGGNYVFRNDGGRCVVIAVRPRTELATFRQDPERYLLASFERLPERPDFANATRVSDVIGLINYPGHRRRPAGPGIALVGDAAMVADYLWGVGCGWAFQSAEWLVDATATALLRGEDLAPALKRYARRHARQLGPHYSMISDFARVRPLSPLERLIFPAVVADAEVAATFGRVGARAASPLTMFRPAMLARMVRARRRAAPPVDIPPPRSAVETAASGARPSAAVGG